MAALKNTRNITLNGSAVRIEGAAVDISTNGIDSISTYSGGTTPVPGSITLTATPTLYDSGATVSFASPFPTANSWTSGGTATLNQYYVFKDTSNGQERYNFYQVTGASGTFSSTPPTFTSGTGAAGTYGVQLQYAGTQATGTVNIVSGAVTGVTITNGGSGYSSAPAVTFSKPRTLTGTTAAGVAVLTSTSVSSVTINTAGTGYTPVVYTWEYRYGDSGPWIAITTTPGYTQTVTLTLDSAWIQAAGQNLFAQFRVVATQVGYNTSQKITSVAIIRNGTANVSINYSNDSMLIPVDANNNANWTASGGVLEIYEGGTLLTLNSNTPSISYPATIQTYNLNITKVSGDTLTVPTITGAGTTTATLGQWNGTLAGLTLYRITAYVRTSLSTTVAVSTDIYIKVSRDPILYYLSISSPVITKQAASALISGVHSSITIQGKSTTGTTTTNYGWVTVTANGVAEAASATDTSTTPITLAPTTTEGKLFYTIKMYNQQTVAGAVLLDIEVVYVVFKGNTGSTGENAIIADLVSKSDVVSTNSSGLGYVLPTGNSIRLYSGSTLITSGVTYGGTTTQSGLTLTVDSGTGAITLSGANWTSNQESFTLTATYNSIAYTTIYNIAKSITGARGSITGSGLSYNMINNVWSDNQANRVVSNIINSQSLTTDLATTAGNRIGDTVTLSNTGVWIQTRGIFSGTAKYIPGDIVLNTALTTAMVSKTINTSTTFGDTTHWAPYKGNLAGSTTSWSASTNYGTNALVTNSTLTGASETFLAKVAHTSGPTFVYEVNRGGSPWTLTRGTYSAATEYAVDDIVISGTTAYICIDRTKGNAVTDPLYWRQFRTSLGTSGAWGSGTSYAFNAVRTAADVGGTTQTWICNYAHTSAATFAADRDRTEFSETRYWSGSAWLALGQVIDGNLLVKGTITGDKITAGTVTVDSLSSGTAAALANGGSFYLGGNSPNIPYIGTVTVEQNSTNFGIIGIQSTSAASSSAIAGAAVCANGDLATKTGTAGLFAMATSSAYTSWRTIGLCGGPTYGLIGRFYRDAGTAGNNTLLPQNEGTIGSTTEAGNFLWRNNTSPSYSIIQQVKLATASNALEVIVGSTLLLNTQITGTLSISSTLTASGNAQINSLGVGTAASGTTGEIRATGNITAYYSDDRLKTRLNNIDNALSKVCSLNGFHYTANDLAVSLGYKQVPEVGISAQEVQQVLPQVVVPAPIDSYYLTVRYERLIPLLIEAIKELKQELDKLKVVIK